MKALNIWFFAAFNFIYYLSLMLLYGGEIISSDLSLPAVGTDWILIAGSLVFLVLALILPSKRISGGVLTLVSAVLGVYVCVRYLGTAIAFAKADAWFFTLFVVAFTLSCLIAAVISAIRFFSADAAPKEAQPEEAEE
ncbi:MAG: hypothetical protein IJY56_01170 [Clostridia bacterium]|nr:hypothetical protein [Clostridia bacterium]